MTDVQTIETDELSWDERIEQFIAELSADIPEEMSPYKLASIVSRFHGRKIPPQMMYNYVKNGMLKVSTNSLGHKVVSRETAIEFLAKYSPKTDK